MLTLHYQRPINETQAFPFRSFEGEKLVEEAHFHQAISDFDTWDAFACGFDRIVSFANLAAHSGEQVEKQ